MKKCLTLFLFFIYFIYTHAQSDSILWQRIVLPADEHIAATKLAGRNVLSFYEREIGKNQNAGIAFSNFRNRLAYKIEFNPSNDNTISSRKFKLSAAIDTNIGNGYKLSLGTSVYYEKSIINYSYIYFPDIITNSGLTNSTNEKIPTGYKEKIKYNENFGTRNLANIDLEFILRKDKFIASLGTNKILGTPSLYSRKRYFQPDIIINVLNNYKINKNLSIVPQINIVLNGLTYIDYSLKATFIYKNIFISTESNFYKDFMVSAGFYQYKKWRAELGYSYRFNIYKYELYKPNVIVRLARSLNKKK
jgi:hypothetical protein